MTGKSAILMLMERHRINNTEMANKLGISRAALWARLDPRKSDNITVNTMQEMLNVLGYEIVIVPAGFSYQCKEIVTIGEDEDD